MLCPSCQKPNADTSKFCQSCGYALQSETQTQSRSPVNVPAAIFIPSSQPQPPSQAHPSQPTPYTPPGVPAIPPAERSAVQLPYHPPAYGATATSILNIWGPFAGYGTRRRHVSWLMDNQGERAVSLVQIVDTKFKERKIPETRFYKSTLTARGVGVERRPYFMFQRGLVTMGLYIATFGRDLFLSLVSYLKPPISTFRAFIVVGMLIFQTFMTFAYPLALNATLNEAMAGVSLFGGSGRDLGAVFFLVCLVGPLGFVNTLLLFLLFGFSAYKWLTERDFLAALRVLPNEFNEDDLVAMEKAVEQTVRLALDDIGLSFDDFKRVEMTEKVWRI